MSNADNCTGGDPRFHQLLRQIGKLHSDKSHDYGSGEDPLANVRASSEFGIPSWLGVFIRMNDKMIRLKAFSKKGALKFEGVEDTLMDIAVYSLMALILFREDNPREGPQVIGRLKGERAPIVCCPEEYFGPLENPNLLYDVDRASE